MPATATSISPSIRPSQSAQSPSSLPVARSLQHAASAAVVSVKARFARAGEVARRAISRRPMRTLPAPTTPTAAHTMSQAPVPAPPTVAGATVLPAGAAQNTGKLNGSVIARSSRRSRPETARPAVGREYAPVGTRTGTGTRAVHRQRPATASKASAGPVVHRSRSEPHALDYEMFAELEEQRSVRLAALRRMSDAGPGAGTGAANMESTDEDEDDVVFV